MARWAGKSNTAGVQLRNKMVPLALMKENSSSARNCGFSLWPVPQKLKDTEAHSYILFEPQFPHMYKISCDACPVFWLVENLVNHKMSIKIDECIFSQNSMLKRLTKGRYWGLWGISWRTWGWGNASVGEMSAADPQHTWKSWITRNAQM